MNKQKKPESTPQITQHPDEDIRALDNNLAEAQLRHTIAAEELGYQRSIIKAIRPFWEQVHLDTDNAQVVGSTASVLLDWRKQSELWNEDSKLFVNDMYLASSTASVIAFNTVSFTDMFPFQPAIDRDQLVKLASQKDEKAEVKRLLG